MLSPQFNTSSDSTTEGFNRTVTRQRYNRKNKSERKTLISRVPSARELVSARIDLSPHNIIPLVTSRNRGRSKNNTALYTATLHGDITYRMERKKGEAGTARC